MSRYVAYIGSYTNYGKSKGIALYDVDVEKGSLSKREEVEVNNCAAMCVSADHRFLYAVVDEGVKSFSILPDGSLQEINTASIRGMRGCSIVVDKQNRFAIVAGYHDSKLTVLRLMPDGSVGQVTDSYFEQGYGSVVEGNFSPHISCVALTPDEDYVCAVVSALDHIKVFKLDYRDGTLSFADVIRCELESQPRKIAFGNDGRHLYIMSEKKSYIAVFNYQWGEERPIIGFKQLVSTLPKKGSSFSVACAIKVLDAGDYVVCSNAGENSVALFERNQEDGLLYQQFVLPVSGDYPKDIMVFPGSQYLLSLNHVSNSLTCFKLVYDKKYMVMNGRALRQDYPNCGVFVKIEE